MEHHSSYSAPKKAAVVSETYPAPAASPSKSETQPQSKRKGSSFRTYFYYVTYFHFLAVNLAIFFYCHGYTEN